jgi:hypothetical protein
VNEPNTRWVSRNRPELLWAFFGLVESCVNSTSELEMQLRGCQAGPEASRRQSASVMREHTIDVVQTRPMTVIAAPLSRWRRWRVSTPSAPVADHRRPAAGPKDRTNETCNSQSRIMSCVGDPDLARERVVRQAMVTHTASAVCVEAILHQASRHAFLQGTSMSFVGAILVKSPPKDAAEVSFLRCQKRRTNRPVTTTLESTKPRVHQP